MKYGKSNYVHQIIDGITQPQLASTPFGHATPSSSSRDAVTTQLSKLIQQLCIVLPSSSIATLIDSKNVACMANSSPSVILSSFSNLTLVKHYIILVDGSSRLVLGKSVLHDFILLSHYLYHLIFIILIFLLNCSLLDEGVNSVL